MVRRLQQPPASEHVEAFLLGASHGGLRSHFGIVFSHIDEAPVLDALLRKTHWLKDHQLQLCMHQVTRGAWWGEAELVHDIERRPGEDAVKIAEWLGVSGMHDVMQDERLETLRSTQRGLRVEAAPAPHRNRPPARRVGAAHPLVPGRFGRATLAHGSARDRAAQADGLRECAAPAHDDGARIGAQRDQPRDRPRWLRSLLAAVRPDGSRDAPPGGARDAQAPARRDATAGAAAGHDPVEQRVKAMQIVQELGLGETMRTALLPLCSHPNARVRSKAVGVLGEVNTVGAELIVEKVLHDSDPRVRANAIEVLEAKRSGRVRPTAGAARAFQPQPRAR
jgi:hypothetical protein